MRTTKANKPTNSTRTMAEPQGSDKSAEFEAELAQRKALSVGQLLLRAARLWNEQALGRIRSVHRLRPAHVGLMPHVALEGTPMTELVERVGTTKQAVSQLVRELEEMGLLQRTADPADGRAKLVCFTAAGQHALMEGLSVLEEVESEVGNRLGPSAMIRLRRDLTRLAEALQRST